jgi:hypothetical protein
MRSGSIPPLIVGVSVLLAAMGGVPVPSENDPAARVASSGPARPNTARSDGYEIAVTKVQPVPTDRRQTVYSIAYRYAFQNREQVEIEGLGPVSATGELSYLSPDSFLRFHDRTGGSVITVPLKITRPPEGAAVDLPNDSDFKPVFLSGAWKSPSPFRDRLEVVLGRSFAGYMPRYAKPISSYITPYLTLEAVPQNLRAQVALRVSFPYGTMKNQTGFRLQYAVRHRRVKSDEWLFSANDTVQKAARGAVDVVIAALRTPQ